MQGDMLVGHSHMHALRACAERKGDTNISMSGNFNVVYDNLLSRTMKALATSQENNRRELEVVAGFLPKPPPTPFSIAFVLSYPGPLLPRRTREHAAPATKDARWKRGPSVACCGDTVPFVQ